MTTAKRIAATSRARQPAAPIPAACLIAPLAFALLLAPPAAAAPSFPCDKARTPAEQIICGDATLADLDQRVADAFRSLRNQADAAGGERLLREQRAWLADRDRRCGIPATGGAPTLAQRWQWAPCLADRYRERLTRLGAPPAPLTQPAAAADPLYVHPLCLDLALGARADSGNEPPAPVLIEACNRGYRHVPVTGRDTPGWLAADDISGEGYGAWFSYRPLGAVSPGRSIVRTEWSGGGTGVFSEIVEVVRSPGGGAGLATIVAHPLFGGGDRCNGGIADASLSGGTLDITVRATPASLIEAGDAAIDVPRFGLYDCAICCAGTLRYRYDLAGGRAAVAGAGVSEALAAEDEGADSAQACFDKLVRGRGALPQTWSSEELTAFSKRFATTCPAGETR